MGERAEAKAEAAKVKMEHVTFCYPGSQESALEDISFTAKAGETIGIIGGTGSGKTTLVNLIPRFYDVTEGKSRNRWTGDFKIPDRGSAKTDRSGSAEGSAVFRYHKE